jgi:hypothetical protein
MATETRAWLEQNRLNIRQLQHVRRPIELLLLLMAAQPTNWIMRHKRVELLNARKLLPTVPTTMLV